VTGCLFSLFDRLNGWTGEEKVAKVFFSGDAQTLQAAFDREYAVNNLRPKGRS
jgi:hypothetical protein